MVGTVDRVNRVEGPLELQIAFLFAPHFVPPGHHPQRPRGKWPAQVLRRPARGQGEKGMRREGACAGICRLSGNMRADDKRGRELLPERERKREEDHVCVV